MLLVYVEKITPRVQYIFRFIGRHLFEQPFQLTSDKNFYRATFGNKLNYSSAEIEADELFIRPVQILFQDDLAEQNITPFDLNFHKAFFATEGDYPFDIFAASFYLITRYEEVLHAKKNPGQPFIPAESIAVREHFIDLPLVNIWINEFKIFLENKFPDLSFARSVFHQILTYDIRHAYKIRFADSSENFRRLLAHILKGDLSSFNTDLKIMKGKQTDPFDVFEKLDALHLYCRVRPYFFFNVSQEYINGNKKLAQETSRLVQYYASNFRVGLLWNSRSSDDKEWMEVIADKKISSARHPAYDGARYTYYRNLLKAGIEEDFSMGYASRNGFRASVCSSYYWFDLENDEETSLRLFPVCFRDLSAIASGSNAGSAYNQLMSYYNLVKKLNGLMVTSWSNELPWNETSTGNWRKMFELYMKEQVYWDAYLGESAEGKP